jgi:hypothetical protein
VSEWSARRKRAEKADLTALGRAPSARTIARLLTVGRERLSKAETITVAAIESSLAILVDAREIIFEFQDIIRRKALAELDTWLPRARDSPSPPSRTACPKTRTRSRRRSHCHGRVLMRPSTARGRPESRRGRAAFIFALRTDDFLVFGLIAVIDAEPAALAVTISLTPTAN